MEIQNNGFDPSRRSLDFTRPNREAIDRNTPEPATSEDVRERIAEQRKLAAERAAAARQAHLSDRAQNARDSLKAQRIDHARNKASAGTDEAPPASTDQVERNSASQSERAANVRADLLADRAQNARESLTGQRIEAARDKVSLSETSLRMRARASERAQNASDEASRLAELRELHQRDALNSDELIAKAAFKMLSGE